MIGHLAQTYGMLPSQVLAQATTFDIMVSDVSATWANHRRNPSDVENYNQQELEQLFQEARS